MNENKIFYSKYSESDFDIYKTLVYDDDLMRYITGTALTEEQAQTKFKSILGINKKEEKLGYFKILTVTNVFIGDCKLERYKYDPSILEIGYILKKDYWGRGYGTSICKEMLTLASTYFPGQDIIGIIDPDNIASKKLLQKFGFESYFVGVEDNLPTEKLLLKIADKTLK